MHHKNVEDGGVNDGLGGTIVFTAKVLGKGTPDIRGVGPDLLGRDDGNGNAIPLRRAREAVVWR